MNEKLLSIFFCFLYLKISSSSNVENLCFGTNTSIPPIWIDIAKNAADRNSFVSPIANVEFLNWIVHV